MAHMKRMLFLLVLLSGCVSTSGAPSRPATTWDASPIIAAERAFAADASRQGAIAAFRLYAAADATQLAPDPVNAQEHLTTIQGNGSTNLAWGPTYAAIARSGDFGFTTGPYWSRVRDGVLGHYFTIWRKQADGSWKWIFDGGTDVQATQRVADTGAIAMLGASAGGNTTSAAAAADVRAQDVQIATGNAMPSEALATRLAAEAHVNRPNAPPAIGKEAAAALIRQTPDVSYGSVLRAEASQAGDLAFTLGEAHWGAANAQKRGFYARAWQRQDNGWRVVFDELIERQGG
jgi:ketosteroid isomerase-like protein